ncbi:MAG: ornithine carbamoyltransferase, partial [Candidatus Omnitrophica bacterium]|nr:ornithine carbamoyltransferase [Candidatus Omnitrophota bacterium]
KDEIKSVLSLAADIKENPGKFSDRLKGKALGLVFQKPSNRTRVSFEVGMYQLGGYSLYLGPDDIKLGAREATADIAKTLSRYLDALAVRTFSHKNILELAKHATIPVINALSDLSHPCQALADVFTIKEKLGKSKYLKVAFIGDGNNVLNSLMQACAKTGINIAMCTPKGYEPDKDAFYQAQEEAKKNKSSVEIAETIKKCIQGADVIYTDVWISMGQESEKEKRLADFKEFQINSKALEDAKPNYLIMHCLPAHRGEEITGEVLDGVHSVVFDQAENRLHVQKALLIKLLK